MILLSTGDRMLTMTEAQERYGVSRFGLLKALERLNVSPVRIGHCKMISERAVEEAIARASAPAPFKANQ